MEHREVHQSRPASLNNVSSKNFVLELVGQLEPEPTEEYGLLDSRNKIGSSSNTEPLAIKITKENQDLFYCDPRKGPEPRIAVQGSALIVSLIKLSLETNSGLQENRDEELRGISIMSNQGDFYPYARPLGLDLVEISQSGGKVYQKHDTTMLTVDPVSEKIRREIFAINEIAVVSASKYILRRT